MNLQELLSGVALTECRAAGDVEITGISYDTRDLKPGALFAALSGYKTDGHRYIREALEKGAAAVLCQRAPDPAAQEAVPRAACGARARKRPDPA